ncbi:MAG TPA: FecR family protein [Candidatus Eisenbacteria bacterium]|nr:FecR family protein [Candidatus Eisenbacteria bacterium]
MRNVAAQTPSRRRGGRRVLIVLVILAVIVGGGIFWINLSAQAAVNVSGTLTVYQPTASLARGTGAYSPAVTGKQVQAGDSVKTDTKGRASVQLPDGTLTRMASNTEITLDSAHFTKNGSLHDAKIIEKVGRTLTSVRHLVAGATFQVAGQSAVASVRGTKFEVYIKADGTMIVKLFDGELDFDGKNHVHLTSGQQATADPQGNIGPAGPIQPDPDDPFGPALAASDAVAAGTTLGTEQDFIGAPLHNGEQQTYSYSYAGGPLLKASLGYPGSAMQLKVQAPDGQIYTGTGPSPIVVVVNNAPAGIYKLTVIGVSGLGAVGEEPFVAVATVEPCVSSDIDQNGAVRRGYTAQDLAAAVQVSGLSNLRVTIDTASPAGAIVTGTGTYNGVGWTGSVLLVAHSGVLDIIAVGGTVFGVNVPAQQIVSQIGSAIGQDPSSLNPGFVVDRLFACNSVVMIDGRHGG